MGLLIKSVSNEKREISYFSRKFSLFSWNISAKQIKAKKAKKKKKLPHFFLRNSSSFLLPYERKFSRNFLFAENPLINETLRRESFMTNENEKNLLRNIFCRQLFFPKILLFCVLLFTLFNLCCRICIAPPPPLKG